MFSELHGCTCTLGLSLLKTRQVDQLDDHHSLRADAQTQAVLEVE